MHGIEKRSLEMNLDPINVITFTSIPYVKSVSVFICRVSTIVTCLFNVYHTAV